LAIFVAFAWWVILLLRAFLQFLLSGGSVAGVVANALTAIVFLGWIALVAWAYSRDVVDDWMAILIWGAGFIFMVRPICARLGAWRTRTR
jgi:hypothetical protein